MLFLSIYYQKNIVTDAGDANMSRVAQLKNCLWKCHMSDEVTYNSGAILNLAMVEERFNYLFAYIVNCGFYQFYRMKCIHRYSLRRTFRNCEP